LLNHRIFIVPLLLTAVLGGCGTSPAGGIASAQAPSYELTIVRESSVQHLAPLRRVIRDPKTVRKLYAAMLSVKPEPRPFIYMCPVDLGVSYTLTFNLAGKAVQATADGSGCRFIRVQGRGTLWSARKSGDAFWSEMGQILRMTPAELRG
jgi:hypothetical protein